MRVLVVGGGGREHALCLALLRDPGTTWVGCAPGNAGIADVAECLPLDVGSADAVAALAGATAADLVVIGPEVPLVAGAADAVRAAGVPCFGPSAAAARLEGSKAFAKQVMAEARVPTADAHVVGGSDELDDALAVAGPPYVVKDDGLAAGKGVVVTGDLQAARAHGLAVLGAGGSVVVESYLDGPEVSLFAVTDGVTVVPLLPAQDHKRVGDGNTGPNTGGMGAYAPLPWAPLGLVDDVVATVVQPTVDAMRRRGTPFVGLLYAGLALTSAGTRVVEFNARFGDPETQAVLALLATPLGGLLHAAATGGLATVGPLRWHDGAAVTVVLAAPGYPAAPTLGGELTGLAEAAAVPGVQVLHAGTRRDGERVLASGGRVLSVTATGADLPAARAAAYEALGRIDLAGGHARTDIGQAAAAGPVAGPPAPPSPTSEVQP
ncbi:MAG: phosphoribosylamine--glycine ligase [Actinomycetota bacterium]|nr:phosphoribosylamine--glycine ligase [Actinomycetota bacterium]